MAALSSSSSSSSNLPMGSNSNSNTNLQRKVRVVAKIRGFGDSETEFQGGIPWIALNKPKGEDSDSVTVSFGEQTASHKDSYEVDYCYDKDEDNEYIFSREVKPLISKAFEGSNATVIAYGARNTGKTSVIQGSFEKPGLAALAMSEILSAAEENGKSVTVSFYEVYQDRVCDLLDSKQQAVFVLEDKRGKIQLKGLSQVPVRSLSEFQKLYVDFGSSKPLQKTSEPPPRGHRGLIVNILSSGDNLCSGTMNFVDLAGYEGYRRKTIDGSNLLEQNRINTSVYAFLNVFHSLSVNESHVPFRESKLARILQDSLGGPSKVLMIVCLNPTFCQDSIYMMKLASRTCQDLINFGSKSTKKSQSSVRPSNKSEAPKTVSATEKKHLSSRRRIPLSEKKVNSVFGPFGAKGRKLFGEKSESTPSNKVKCSIVDNGPTVEQSTPSNKVESPVVDSVLGIESLKEEENVLLDVFKHDEHTYIIEKDIHQPGDKPELVTPIVDVNTNTNSVTVEQGIENENESSPPISARLRELSNNLKALCNTTPRCPITLDRNDASTHSLEPRTPLVDTKSSYKSLNSPSPWGTLVQRSAGIKSSVVHEYLKFLNTADKDELKRLRGIGEKRATWILELRDESPEPFKSVEDLKNIGIYGKKVVEMMKMDIEGV